MSTDPTTNLLGRTIGGELYTPDRRIARVCRACSVGDRVSERRRRPRLVRSRCDPTPSADQATIWTRLPSPSWPGGVAQASRPSPIEKPGSAGTSCGAPSGGRASPVSGSMCNRLSRPIVGSAGVGDPDREPGRRSRPSGRRSRRAAPSLTDLGGRHRPRRRRTGQSASSSEPRRRPRRRIGVPSSTDDGARPRPRRARRVGSTTGRQRRIVERRLGAGRRIDRRTASRSTGSARRRRLARRRPGRLPMTRLAGPRGEDARVILGQRLRPRRRRRARRRCPGRPSRRRAAR